MKFIIVFVALFAVALAAPGAPGSAGPVVEIVRQESDVGPENFSFGWETSDGSKANAEGHVENAGAENEGIAVRGSYSYIGPDGVTYLITYVADENGYQPEGAHLPVAP